MTWNTLEDDLLLLDILVHHAGLGAPWCVIGEAALQLRTGRARAVEEIEIAVGRDARGEAPLPGIARLVGLRDSGGMSRRLSRVAVDDYGTERKLDRWRGWSSYQAASGCWLCLPVAESWALLAMLAADAGRAPTGPDRWLEDAKALAGTGDGGDFAKAVKLAWDMDNCVSALRELARVVDVDAF